MLLTRTPVRDKMITERRDSMKKYLGYLIVIIVKAIVKGIDTPGYSSLMCVMLFLGGLQLIFLGILGEYLGKTYNETKNRPIYIAKEEIGFDEEYL